MQMSYGTELYNSAQLPRLSHTPAVLTLPAGTAVDPLPQR